MPDITNLTRLHLYEIKPVAAQALGAAKATACVGLFSRAGVAMTLGPTGEPGTEGEIPAPDGVYMFWSPEPGVIVYQYRKGRLVPVPVPEPDPVVVRRWRFELQPMAQQQQQAITTLTVGLLSSDNQPWLYPKRRHFPFVEATLAVWDEFDAVGPRYHWGSQGERLWTLPNSLHYVLANLATATTMATMAQEAAECLRVAMAIPTRNSFLPQRFPRLVQRGRHQVKSATLVPTTAIRCRMRAGRTAAMHSVVMAS